MHTNNQPFLKYLLIFVIGFISFYLIQNLTSLDGLTFLNQKTATITVRGSAQKDVLNQLAEFTAGIEVVAIDKDEAINSANEIMNQLLDQIENFGIDKQNVQTSQVSVYQEDKIIDPSPEIDLININQEKIIARGNWRANLSITMTMRDEDSNLLKNRSEELLNILNNSQATYVYGPNFRLDDQNSAEIELINEAVADAESKAQAIAANSGQKIKKVLEIVEDGINYQPYYYGGDVASEKGIVTSASLEPGSSTLSKSVVVTFQVK